jgi:hypothetical protein
MRRPITWGWWCSRRSDGTLNRGLVCITRIRSYTDLKDPDAHVLDGWVPATRKRCTKHAPSSKTECGHINGGKSKAVTYAFPPGYRENAEEEEEVPWHKVDVLSWYFLAKGKW